MQLLPPDCAGPLTESGYRVPSAGVGQRVTDRRRAPGDGRRDIATRYRRPSASSHRSPCWRRSASIETCLRRARTARGGTGSSSSGGGGTEPRPIAGAVNYRRDNAGVNYPASNSWRPTPGVSYFRSGLSRARLLLLRLLDRV